MKYFTLSLLLLFLACSQQKPEDSVQTEVVPTAKGSLFIIGGGKRPPHLVKEMVERSGIDSLGYGIILPMSSSEPDSSIFYALIQFTNQGLSNVIGMNFNKGDIPLQSQLDSIENASLIYISGGDQNKFMDIAGGTDIEKAINACYKNGGMIAGTSAGAAVMSEKMITGDELKYPDYNATFRNIETQNIKLARGLGFLKTSIVDQHFIKRSRHNRLISAILDHPELMGIGIDESTAIYVKNNTAEIIGDNQVIVFDSPKGIQSNSKGKLSATSFNISLYTAGQSFEL